MFSRSRPFSFFGKMPRTGDPLANLTNLFKRKIVKNLSNYSGNCNALTSIPKIVVRGALLALFAFSVLLPGAEPALASTKPVNIVGKWKIVSVGGNSSFKNISIRRLGAIVVDTCYTQPVSGRFRGGGSRQGNASRRSRLSAQSQATRQPRLFVTECVR